MKCVYEASTALDAHMILDLLQQQRIPGRIEGEYLQGAVGGIQTMGLVRVLVDEFDYNEAKKIINEWESAQPISESPETEMQPYSGFQIFIMGVFVGAGIMFFLMKGLA